MTYLRFKIDTSGGRGGVRDARGRFIQMNDARLEFRAFNQRMARTVQSYVVENMASSIQRRNVSSGRLLAVTASPKNIEVDDFHFGVGVENYLNNSMAKYWRTIEEGSLQAWGDTPGGRASFVGMELTGLWGANIGRVTPDRVYGKGPWYRHSPRRGDKFVPKGRFKMQSTSERGFGSWRFAKFKGGAGGKKGQPNFVRTTTVKNEIQPHHDYADAFQKADLGPRALAEVDSILGKAARAAWRVE